MRSRFEHELELLNMGLIEMGAQIESAIENAVQGLVKQDAFFAKKAIEFDGAVNRMERDIENRCLRLLLQQQPVAKDLRLVSTAMRMITDMERIGDQAADIAELTLRHLDAKYIKKIEHIPQMARAAIKMVRESIDAFVSRDLSLAQAVIQEDDLVDSLFIQIRTELIDLIHENKEYGEQAMDLFMIAKYLERIADHAVNIGEWVVFAITGEHVNNI